MYYPCIIDLICIFAKQNLTMIYLYDLIKKFMFLSLILFYSCSSVSDCESDDIFYFTVTNNRSSTVNIHCLNNDHIGWDCSYSGGGSIYNVGANSTTTFEWKSGNHEVRSEGPGDDFTWTEIYANQCQDVSWVVNQ